MDKIITSPDELIAHLTRENPGAMSGVALYTDTHDKDDQSQKPARWRLSIGDVQREFTRQQDLCNAIIEHFLKMAASSNSSNDTQIFTDVQPDQALYDEVQAASVRGFEEKGIKHVGECYNYFNYPYPARLHILREQLRIYVLRETGDYRLFIEASEKINKAVGHPAGPFDDFLLHMALWLRDAIDGLKEPTVQTRKPRVVLSMLAWGGPCTQRPGTGYLERVSTGLLRSWLAPGNIATLCERYHATLYVHTTEAGRAELAASDELKRLALLGLNVEYHLVPDALIEYMRYIREEIWDPSARFWLVGASAALGLAYARLQGAAYHQVVPDAVYSGGYFKELLRLSKDHGAIMQQSVRTDNDVMRDALKPYEKDGVIDVSSPDLVSLSLNSVHLSNFNFIVNNRVLANATGLPDYHLLYWESEDQFHINSPHNDMVYLAPELVKKVRDRYFSSFDSELDLVIQDEPFYLPRATDEFFKAELTPSYQYGVIDWYVTAEDFARSFWKQVVYRNQLGFFERGQSVKLNPALRRPVGPVWALEDVRKEQQWVYECLRMTQKLYGDIPEVSADAVEHKKQDVA